MNVPQRLVILQWIGVAAGFTGFWLSWCSTSFGWHPVWLDPMVFVLLLCFTGIQIYWLWRLRRLKQS